MKALVYEGPNKTVLKDVPKPINNQDEILVKVKYAAVCGTDIRIYRGTKKIPSPRILGHEFSGVIEEKGENVKGYDLGENITVYPMIACGYCYACKRNRTNICVNRETIGYQYDGGFAEFVKIPSKAIKKGNVIKIPSQVSLREGAISEPIAAALHGIDRAAINKEDILLIIGAGPIGLFHVQLARLNNPRSIIVSEPLLEKRDLAKKFGADILINPMQLSIADLIKEQTDGKGVDKIFIDLSIPRIIEESLLLLRKGGKLVIFAGSPEGSKITIDPNVVHYKEIDLIGSSSSTPDNHRKVLDLIKKKRLDLSVFTKDVFELEDWQQAFEGKEKYRNLKPIFHVS